MGLRRCECGGSFVYSPAAKYTSYDAHGAGQTGRRAGAAFNAGHPGLAVAQVAMKALGIAGKELYARARPYICDKCGKRSG